MKIGGYVLSAYGYVPNAAQSDVALDGIRMSVSLFPALGFLLCIVCLYFYRISRSMEIEMTDALTERRRTFAVTAGEAV